MKPVSLVSAGGHTSTNEELIRCLNGAHYKAWHRAGFHFVPVCYVLSVSTERDYYAPI
jgi:hypothetical protein